MRGVATPDERLVLAETVERDACIGLFGAPSSSAVAERAGRGALTYIPGVTDTMMCRIFGFGDTPALTDLDRALERFALANVARFFLQVAPHAVPSGFDAWLASHRLVRYRRSWAKFARGTADPPRPPTELDVGPAEPEERGAIIHLLATTFHLPGEAEPVLEGLFGVPGFHVFAARAGDRVVGTGSVYANGDAAWLGFGATDASFRGRGAQSAILAERVARARDLGVRHVFTETGEAVPGEPQPSYRNIERAGFSVLYSRANYVPDV
jgi:hypothetical protein